MHAGCRRRIAAVGQAGVTGSEELLLGGLPGACHDLRLLRSPPVRC